MLVPRMLTVCNVAVNNLPPMAYVTGPRHFVRVNRCTLVLDGPEMESAESPC